jgi:hypothetical protein
MGNKIRNKLHQYLRKQRHEAYILSRIVELRNQICRQACMYGTVDEITRTVYLKY